MSLQYCKKEVRYEVDFLHADKHQSFLQGYTIIIDGHNQTSSKYSKYQVCNSSFRDGFHFFDCR